MNADTASPPTKPADALVVFGASGDLAHKKIFAALCAMGRSGALKVPVIGVASSRWSVEQFCARPGQRRERRPRGQPACTQ
ncbi:hypothetical protein LJY18_19465 [Pseudomonas sp. MMS21-TM103]|uniref:hypothetical protein n=1 Tax=Pseudomonas sp. MMS21 TM103 TaxID=2886506 RepID=UPI001EDFAA9A|nr:hypothetical protein [Pseudomonas sp. MMS21 TM103]MCG4455449.1 hypothetical protein [Pseudomonas sp. MMS21 TM103]